MVEQGFRQNTATGIACAHKQNIHGDSIQKQLQAA